MRRSFLNATVALGALVLSTHGAGAQQIAGAATPATTPNASAPSLIVPTLGAAQAQADASSEARQGPSLPLASTKSQTADAAPAGCVGPVDPYKNYACLDTYLGNGFFERLYNYYKLEWGQSGPPADPNAPPGRRDGWPPTPETTPPMPFTEWPYGGVTSIGVTTPNSIDSPLMAALGNTGFGQWMADNHFQIYGWVDPGFNISSNTARPGGNSPIAYAYTPNTIQLDQAVIYLDRFIDTVQTDHIDWGMRVSAIYGENYRYTQSYSPFTAYQFNHDNSVNGYDFPMVYGELYIPQVAQGLVLRVGRYISLPDIEAQLAPNNYMYTHSLTYAYDNYTNEGIQGTLALTKQLMIQLGVSVGTEAWIGHYGQTVPNPLPWIPASEVSALGLGSHSIQNPLYGGPTFPKDPGAVPSYTACFRYTFNDGNDNIYPCADAINGGQWGYNNIQWYGTTIYHKFSDSWHISYEFYDIHANGVPNENNPLVQYINTNGGTPFANLPFNGPNEAQCHSSAPVGSTAQPIRCNAHTIGTVAYVNYSPGPLDNISFRPEFYDDAEGWRTGTKATYYEFSLGWQHWLSPQVEFRPEVGYYRSIDAKAFNIQTPNTCSCNEPKNYTVIGAMDMILHF
jgi:hypothetical protein